MAKRNKSNKNGRIDAAPSKSSTSGLAGALGAQLVNLNMDAVAPGPEPVADVPSVAAIKTGRTPIEDFRLWRMNISKKGRGGKTVTIVHHVQNLEHFCDALKKALGTGARIEDGTIVLQGDRRSAIDEFIHRRNL